MPNYDYKCKSCGHTEEVMQSINDKALVKCPKCKKKTFERVIFAATVVYKVGGFHGTDYKK